MHQAATNVTIPPEVREFCASRDLAASLELALSHVVAAFPDALAFSVALEDDAESDHNWVVIDFVARGSVGEVHPRFIECSRAMTRALGLPAAPFIRANYTIAKEP